MSFRPKKAATKTDANGRFAFTGLRGGAYVLATKEQQSLYRLWAANTAPPAAQHAALVVHQGQVTRGQLGGIISASTAASVAAAGALTWGIVEITDSSS